MVEGAMTALTIEVFRESNEMARRHGVFAHKYAAKLAAEASAEGKAQEHEFWKAVEAALAPRGK
jgi:hypothetical protein